MLDTYKLAFMAEVVPAAKRACARYGVPYQVCCAQAAIDSGYGKCIAHYNFFGIRAKGDAGTQTWMTRGFTGSVSHGGYQSSVDTFAKFSSAEAAFDAYARLVAAGRQSYDQYLEAIVEVCQLFYKHLPELAMVSDKVLQTYGVTRADADAAMACAPDFNLQIAKG